MISRKGPCLAFILSLALQLPFYKRERIEVFWKMVFKLHEMVTLGIDFSCCEVCTFAGRNQC